MDQEPTRDEVERRARKAARRLMSTPYERQRWPGKPSATAKETHGGASKPSTPDPSAEAS